MSIYYLNVEDFALSDNMLTHSIPGITLVMFFTQTCKFCSTFMPQYQSLPGSIIGVNFALCCLDGKNGQIVKMSKSSSTPIPNVPKFILYTDGIPYIEYTGQRNRQSVLSFLQDIVIKLNQKQSFTKPKRSREALETPHGGAAAGGRIMPPASRNSGGAPEAQGGSKFKIIPSTGVKEYETSYGLPYNAGNEANFLEYESAYLNKGGAPQKRN